MANRVQVGLTPRQKQVRFQNIKQAVRNSLAERNWSMAVRAKAGFKCTECDKVEGLTAHHLIPIGDLIVKLNLETPEQAIACKDLFKVEYGVCLCPECHAKRHPENAQAHFEE